MTTILERLPFFSRETSVSISAEQNALVRDHQIIVWVSLGPPGQRSLPPGTPRFPALLDTGNTFSFSIQESHIRQWSGLLPETLVSTRSISLSDKPDQKIPVLSCNVWLWPNMPGQRDEFAADPPFCLELNGIAMFPAVLGNLPRLPLLGLRALVMNRLHLSVDGDALNVTLATA